MSDTRIVDADGWAGDFHVTLETPDDPETLEVGGILIAEPSDADWVAEVREHFPLDTDDEGRAIAHGGSQHPAESGEPGIILAPYHDETDPTAVLAAADAATVAMSLDLASPTSMRFHFTSKVDPTLCGACASCVKTCAFGACSIDHERGISVVDVRRCSGCGKCVVSCPVGARDITNAPHDHLLDAIRMYAEMPVTGERVLGFLCAGCGYPAADKAAAEVASGSRSYPASFLPLRINCGGRLDALYVLEAFKHGFDGVAVFRCREGHCRNRIGNLDMDRRINLLRTVLRSRAIDDARLRIIDITGTEGGTFLAEVNGFYSDLAEVSDGKGGAQ
jgi:coenzyme F420-reducing hydrogenase delta subunit/Pyruvate/2-oxoacid:ferredoxin oxidoreductase delta subunit